MRAQLTVTADASSVVTELRRGAGAQRDFRREGEATASALNRSAREQEAALNSMAAAAAKAAIHQDDLVAAEMRAIETRRRAQSGPVNVFSQPVASSNPAGEYRFAETAADGLRQTVSGMSVSLTASVEDMMLATVEAREYRAALDEVRMAFSPLFAASKRYEAELDAIARAERIGAISAREAADARQRAARIIAPTAPAQSAPSGSSGTDLYAAFQKEQADHAARSYRALEDSLNPVIRAERELAAAQEVVNRAVAQGQTTNTAAARTLAQLETRYQGVVRAHSPAAQSAQAMERAIEAEAEAVRQLTFSLDPAARATAELERAQQMLANAVRHNSITQTEATRLLGLFETRQQMAGRAGLSMGMGVQNASYQIADFAVQVQAGQSASLALAQQLPQLLGGFGVIGAVLGAVVAVGVPLVKMLFSTKDAAGTLDERLQKLEKSSNSVRDSLKLLRDQNLGLTFGDMTGSVRKMTEAMLELDRATQLRSMRESLDTLMGETVEPTWFQRLKVGPQRSSDAFPVASREQLLEVYSARNFTEMTGGKGPSYAEFTERRSLIDDLLEEGDMTRVQDEIASLITDFRQSMPLAEMSAELELMLGKLRDVAVEAAERGADFNGTARAEAIKREVDAMVQGYSQQAELARTAVQFGSQSVQVEEARARHAREALTLRLREAGVLAGTEEESRAIAALERDIAATAEASADQRRRDQDELFAGLAREAEISTVILRTGRDGAEAEAVRARHAREVNAERLKEMGLAPGLIALAQQLFDVEQKRVQTIKDADAARGADDLLADLREEAEINRAIVLHGRESLQVKELQIGAERRAFEQSLKSLEVSEQRKRELRAEWEMARGLASSDPFGQVAGAREILQGQQERITQLRLEQSLLGQTEATRNRILILWRAEQDIRRQGFDAGGTRAAQIRAAAEEEAELTRSLERQKDAWGAVQSAAESAIDGIFEKLRGGDFEGALEALASDIGGMFSELAITNPIKNAILGMDLGTMEDVGGLKGIWARLTGREDPSSIALPDPTTSVASMDVQAATVVLGGPGVASLLGGMPGAANSAAAPGRVGGGLAGPADVQSQVWSFFAGKGLQPHQVAAIMGNVSAESSFNPNAKGDHRNGVPTSFGLFQHHASRGQGLLSSVGGQAGLGNVEGQLEYVWKELLTSEAGVLQRLKASTNVQDATAAFVGFERPQGWSAANPTGAHNFDGRLAAAEAAMTTFSQATQTASGDLGTLGKGFDIFGSALSGAASGGPQGALQGILGGVGTMVAGALGIPGFAAGGRHVGGLRIVGENGPELEYTGPSTIVPAGLTRQLLSARETATGVANAAAAPVIQLQPVLVNNTSRQMDMQVEEGTDARGQRQMKFVLSDMAAEGLAVPGGESQRTMRSVYGLNRATRRRNS